MRRAILTSLILLSILSAISIAPAALSQARTADEPARPELALDYTYLRSNAPPGGCTCFSLNGGSASFAWPIGNTNFAIVGDLDVAHTGSIAKSGYDLTLTSFTAGARYRFRFRSSALVPFGQVLVGAAHASGSLVQGTNPSISNAGGAFAANVGGGLDLAIHRHLSLRLLDADYLVTTFDNGVNDHQNILRLGAGVVLRF